MCAGLRDEKLYPVAFIYIFNFELVEHYFPSFGPFALFLLLLTPCLFKKKVSVIDLYKLSGN